MKKRLISMLLVICMVLSMAACGKKNTEISYEVSDEPVTLRMYYYAGYGEYTQAVQDELNKMLKGMKGYEHITIELCPSTNYQRDLQFDMAAGEQIDIVSTYNLSDLNNMIKNGDFIELDGLMKQFPEATEEIPDWIVEKGKLYDKQYFIPTYQQATNLTYFAIPTKYLEMYYDVYNKTEEDARNAITYGSVEDKLDFLEQLVLSVRKKTGSETKWIFPFEYWGKNLLSNVFFNQEFVGNNHYGHYILRERTTTPEYWPLTEEFKIIQERFSEWYKKGLLHEECNSVNYHKFIGTNFLNDEAYVNQFVTNTCSEEYLNDYLTDTNGIEMTTFRVTDHAYIGAEWEAGGHAIYADCEHPVEAMMIIELLRTKKGEEFYNTLVYGLEGVHYEWEDKAKDKIITLEYDGHQGGETYMCYKWNTGNVFNAWKNQSVREGFYEYILEEVHEGEDTVFSPASGITWDTSKVENQMIQISTVQGEFGTYFFMADDWEARYDEYIEKLEDAGVQDVLDELKKQYNEYIK